MPAEAGVEREVCWNQARETSPVKKRLGNVPKVDHVGTKSGNLQMYAPLMDRLRVQDILLRSCSELEDKGARV